MPQGRITARGAKPAKEGVVLPVTVLDLCRKELMEASKEPHIISLSRTFSVALMQMQNV